jgi:hypothetical protein
MVLPKRERKIKRFFSGNDGYNCSRGELAQEAIYSRIDSVSPAKTPSRLTAKTLIVGCSKRSQRRGARKIDPSTLLRTGSPPGPEIEGWRASNASLHYSTTPLFQSLVRWSETIERNEAYEAFSAACQASVGTTRIAGSPLPQCAGPKLRGRPWPKTAAP